MTQDYMHAYMYTYRLLNLGLGVQIWDLPTQLGTAITKGHEAPSKGNFKKNAVF